MEPFSSEAAHPGPGPCKHRMAMPSLPSVPRLPLETGWKVGGWGLVNRETRRLVEQETVRLVDQDNQETIRCVQSIVAGMANEKSIPIITRLRQATREYDLVIGADGARSHPTPYILNPAPYTLSPAPYTLNPAP